MIEAENEKMTTDCCSISIRKNALLPEYLVFSNSVSSLGLSGVAVKMFTQRWGSQHLKIAGKVL